MSLYPKASCSNRPGPFVTATALRCEAQPEGPERTTVTRIDLGCNRPLSATGVAVAILGRSHGTTTPVTVEAVENRTYQAKSVPTCPNAQIRLLLGCAGTGKTAFSEHTKLPQCVVGHVAPKLAGFLDPQTRHLKLQATSCAF